MRDPPPSSFLLRSNEGGLLSLLAGVDGCKGGWLAICQDTETNKLTSETVDDLERFATRADAPETICIDIPIGLTDRGPRTCDTAARKLLGPRRNSVFPAPCRPLLGAQSWREAHELGQTLLGKGLSQQAFGIMPKIREVDDLLTENPTFRQRVFEVHPEVSFRAWLGGEPMPHYKKTPDGFAARRSLVDAFFGPDAYSMVRKNYLTSIVANDGVLDAFAALWTTRRIHAGQAQSIPNPPATDPTGLPMAIWY